MVLVKYTNSHLLVLLLLFSLSSCKCWYFCESDSFFPIFCLFLPSAPALHPPPPLLYYLSRHYIHPSPPPPLIQIYLVRLEQQIKILLATVTRVFSPCLLIDCECSSKLTCYSHFLDNSRVNMKGYLEYDGTMIALTRCHSKWSRRSTNKWEWSLIRFIDDLDESCFTRDWTEWVNSLVMTVVISV